MTLAARLRHALAAVDYSDLILLTGDDRDADVGATNALYEAAVLVAVTDRPNPGLILTQRRDDMRNHAGQVAFPGGRIDATDADAVAAALREAHEEIALAPDAVEIVGIADRYRTVTGFDVTPAGLLYGVRALGLATRLVAINPLQTSIDRRKEIAAIVNGIGDRLGVPVPTGPGDVTSLDDYIGEGYGIVTPAGRDAILLAGRTEGLILDPVYTSKALSGLIDHIRTGVLRKGQTVVFIHTGGVPAIFAEPDKVLPGM